jgi:ABC-type uncharacterized transport system auxiliary subunit
MRKYKNALVWIIGGFGLIGCSSILAPREQHAISNYEIVDTSLSDNNIPSCVLPKENSILYVSSTRASLPYDTFKMYYMADKYQLNTYGYSQWVVSANDLINQNILKKLFTSCTFKNVVTSNVVVNANYRLVTNLVMLRHEINQQNNTANAHLIIFSELINLSKNEVVASFVFDKLQATDITPGSYVDGVSKLVTVYDAQLVDWLQTNTK